jgi:hypothetical protein
MGIAFHKKKTEMDSCKWFRSYERYKKPKFTSVYGRTAVMGFNLDPDPDWAKMLDPDPYPDPD